MNLLSQKGVANIPAKNNELQKLLRTNQNLIQLSQKLYSYTCEPCTHHLFEKSEALKARLRQLRNANEKVISSVMKNTKGVDNIKSVVKQQLRDFDELRKGILDYSKSAHGLH